VVIGDSLSDAGNRPAGMATDGNTWAALLGARPSGAGGTNYAHGGALALPRPAPRDAVDLPGQVSAIVGEGTAFGTDPLAVVWIGGRDLLRGGDPEMVTSAIRGAVVRLADETALRRVLLVGLPDYALVPRFRRAGEEARRAASQASRAYNAGLRAVAADDAGRPGLEVGYVDLAALFARIDADPAAFGFQDIEGDCGQGDSAACAGFLFWDDIHPTEAGHRLIAEAILAETTSSPIPLPVAGAVLIAALGGLALLRGRRG
jgi:phospholipase/lecithinase/hemolysin